MPPHPPKVRVCHINTRFLGGGGTKNTLETIRGLDPGEFDVDLIIGRDVYWEQLEGIDARVIQVPSMRRNLHPIWDPLAFLAIYRILRRNRYDIVHTHIAKAGMLGRFAAALARVPLVIHGLHGATFHSGQPAPVRRFYIALERWAARYTHHFVSVGEDLRDRYLEQGIGRPEDYSIVRSGMDLDAFLEAGNWSDERRAAKRRELGLEAGVPLVGYVAALEPRKSHEYALDAASRLLPGHPALRMVFVGEGHRRAELEDMIQERGLDDVVSLLGYRADIAEVMAALDIKIFTSQWEGLPQVLVQAAAAGRPIVTFECEGAREVVRDGYNGYVVPLRDVVALTDRLGRMLDDPEGARTMGRGGRELVDGQWKTTTMVARTEQLYRHLVASSRAYLDSNP